jgi:hypothetical protein
MKNHGHNHENPDCNNAERRAAICSSFAAGAVI